MNMLLKLITVAGVVTGAAAPALAQTASVDPMTMTCADYSAMDEAGMMAATHSADMMMAMTPDEVTAAMAMTDEEKAAAAADAATAMAAMTADETTAATTATTESMAKMVAACAAMPDATVMDAMKGAM